MKLLFFAVSLFPALAAAQTNADFPQTLTLTNNSGEVLTNIHIVKYDAAKIYYVYPGAFGGGSVDLSNLPPSIQKKFHFDPRNALAETRSNELAAEKFKSEQLAARQAVLLQQRYAIIRGQVVSQAFKSPMRVIHKQTDGLLVSVPPVVAEPVSQGTNDNDGPPQTTNAAPAVQAMPQVMFLTDYPAQAVDDQPLEVTAYPYGDYTYTNALNLPKTVLRITCNLDKAVRFALNQPARN